MTNLIDEMEIWAGRFRSFLFVWSSEESTKWKIHTCLYNINRNTYDFIVENITNCCLATIKASNAFCDSNLAFKLEELAKDYDKDYRE